MNTILALDQGTTSSRAIAFSPDGSIRSVAQREFKQIYPQPGWVEHDPEEIWTSQLSVLKRSVRKAGIAAKQIAAIGITNQRESVVVWNRKTGKPICNAIVWQDRRTAPYCDQLKKSGKEPLIRKKTGLLLDAYFSGTKVRWILKNIAGAKALARKGELAFGTVDSWLIWKLTEGRHHITDVTNASRTLLFDIHKLCWDETLLDLFEIPASILPEVRSSSEIYGHFKMNGCDIPIAGVAGDQHAALFGQACTRSGMVKNTYGTGCFMLMHTGKKAIHSKNNLLTTVAWKIGNQTEYALEGSIFIAGAAVQWLRDGLGIIKSSTEIESLAREAQDSGGVYMVPAFAGLGAPHWDPYARGMIAGITRGSSAAHLARAALEGIAFQVHDVVRCMESDSGIKLRELRVDGGASVNNLLMQMQANLLNVPVIRPRISETTALGAAYLAGLAVGFWDDLKSISNQWQAEQKFTPVMDQKERKSALKGWNQAMKRSRNWIKDIE